ncbi:MAG: hypothetical protein AAF936_03885 [Pseudomonadota bacterium]
MSKEPTYQGTMRSTVCREFFMYTADNNYITGRWCYLNGQHLDFYWMSLHALEKYLKCVLLMNGHSGKEYTDAKGKTHSFGHDIVALYTETKSLAGGLLIDKFVQPEKSVVHFWYDESVVEFLKRLYTEGHPDNRYHTFGTHRRPDDIFKVDQIVFSARRICWPLDNYIISSEGRKSTPTFRDFCSNEPNAWRFSVGDLSPLGEAFDGKRGVALKTALLENNLAFAPKDYEHPAYQEHSYHHSPIMLRYIHDYLKDSSSKFAKGEARKLRKWVIENIQLPKEVRREIESW